MFHVCPECGFAHEQTQVGESCRICGSQDEPRVFSTVRLDREDTRGRREESALASAQAI